MSEENSDDERAAFPESIRLINRLPEVSKEAIYRTLLPDFVFTQYGIDRETLTETAMEIPLHERRRVVHFRCPQESRAAEISVYRAASDPDPILYLHLADTFNGQLFVLLVVVNDPEMPRFPTDQLPDGTPTKLGTQARNLAAEVSALHAGLAPGQVRAGLRVFKQLTPRFETFVTRMGQSHYFIEPLAYHNAIAFERYGFQYVRGRMDMERFHREFQPGGALHAQLNGSNVFRQPGAADSVRGRSWAIQDGILGRPYTGFEMVKRIGHFAGVNTFPDSIW